MPSPAPGEIMGIDNMLNERGAATVDAMRQHQHQHQFQQHQQQQQHQHQQLQHQQQQQQHHHHLQQHSHFPPPVSLPGVQRSFQPFAPHPLDRAGSPHGSEHSRFSAAGSLNGLEPGIKQQPFGSPTAMHTGIPDHGSQHQNAGGLILPSLPASLAASLAPNMELSPGIGYAKAPSDTAGDGPPKPFFCQTCTKSFARRSDLARHVRIHTGVRPHVCDYPDCGKQFIQRSALTVHKRVHTGEKPHQCERCGKPFGDSSSLARHRRIHLGKRPYKCPYADCQKTFTRRTTLTRHQGRHTGTIEDAARTTAAALARGASHQLGRLTSSRPPRSDGGGGDQLSSHGASPLSTPSPGQRTLSMSPASEMASSMGHHHHHQQQQQHPFLPSSSLPVHLRGDHHHLHHGHHSSHHGHHHSHIVGSSPTSTASSPVYSGDGGSNSGGMGGGGSGMRPTSHPTGYGPPSTLEPSIEPLQQQQQQGGVGGGPGSVGSSGSPHMSSLGWHSPSQHAAAAVSGVPGVSGVHLASPTHSHHSHHSHNSYVYPDPVDGGYSASSLGQLFYGTGAVSAVSAVSASGAGGRRPGSAEPSAGGPFDVKPRPSELWAAAQ